MMNQSTLSQDKETACDFPCSLLYLIGDQVDSSMLLGEGKRTFEKGIETD